MRALGVDAKVATHLRYKDAFAHFYAQQFKSGDHFLFFDTDDQLLDIAAPYEVIIATLWSTPQMIAPVSRRWPEKLYVYYIQDYEPWFFPQDRTRRQIATDSYTLIPNMVLMAKTDWICRTVRERHGRPVYRVAPSLDHAVYWAGRKCDDSPIRIAAMIRPTTPRRGPVRTLRVLDQVARRLDNKVRMLLFGCEPNNLRTFLNQAGADIELGENFENRGILTTDGVADLLREAHIFVDFSDYQAFGRTGLEAMACGCAVVLPAAGGVYEYARPGHNSLVVDTRSMHEMTQATMRLADESSTRTALAENGLRTASGFDIRRASLSELSVFRAAAAAKMDGRLSPKADYWRGPTSADTRQGAKRITVLLPGADSQAATDTVTERVLLPLLSKSVGNEVEVCAISSIEDLDRERADVLVVYRGTIATSCDAAAVIDRCEELGVALVYGTDAVATLDCPRGMRVESRLTNAASRIVVPSVAIRDDPLFCERDAMITEAACDEELWFDPQVHYTHSSQHDVDGVRLLVYGNSTVHGLLPGVWSRVRVAAPREVSLDLIATNQPVPDGANLIPRGPLPYTDFVRSVLARGPWDIALLMSDTRTAADQRFLNLAAMGLAIVCSNEGRHLCFAHNRQNAMLVENTETAWTRAILELIGARTTRRQLGSRAKEDIAARHGLDRHALGFLDAYGLGPDRYAALSRRA